MNRQRAAGVVLAALVFIASACTGGSDGDDTETTTPVDSLPSDRLPDFEPVDAVDTVDCDTDALAEVPDWPFDLVGLLRPVTASVDELEYRATGVTNDAEGLLVRALDETFVAFDASEPTGGADDIAIEFTDANAAITLSLDDSDDDGCWSVEVVALYSESPATVDQVVPPATDDDTDEPVDSTDEPVDPTDEPDQPEEPDEPAVDPTGNDGGVGAPLDPPDPLDQAGTRGRAEVIGARGTFSVGITRCEIAPVAVDGISSEGTLSLSGTAPDDVSASFVYPDGVEIVDDEARVLALTAAGGTIIFEGLNPDGPETIIVNLACESAR